MNNSSIEIWGGIECTINRVQDTFFSQLSKGRYYQRNNNIETIAELGIKKLRYPILWEFVEQEFNKYNFKNIPSEITKLNTFGITPIAGLVHHGSGPKYTNLNDKNFPQHLARYANKVAQLFPQLEYFTPVNEPLTTARFSCLYGYWYPHQKNNYSFCKAVLNECKATVLAIREIRKINKDAKLIQTEDIGKIKSTPKLQYQADFENCRRWLTYDILCGKIIKGHPMWDFFLYSGVSEDELYFFTDNPCPPDILGINYYVLSERFLDENISRYPPDKIGGNGKHVYADIETVRTDVAMDGLGSIIKEAWARYKIPIAVTELHLSCSREEQLKWLAEGSNTLIKLKRQGINIIALTFWSLFGAFNWHNLLTKDVNRYELGAFELSGNMLRMTAIGKFIKTIACRKSFSNPVLCSAGWWRRPERVLYKVSGEKIEPLKNENGKNILIVGSTGTLGKAFAKVCALRHLKHMVSSREDMNITNIESVKKTIDKIRPWAVINAAGYVNVDSAEIEKIKCFASNTIGAGNLAEVCAKKNIKFMTFSSDLVFSGAKKKPYIETDSVGPVNIYGISKAAAERTVQNINPLALIIRTSSFFSPWDKFNFIAKLLCAYQNNIKFKVPKDIFISPTFVPDLVNRSLDLLIDDESGILHLANSEYISWSQFAYLAAEIFNIDNSFIEAAAISKMQYIARRPLCSALQSERNMMLGNVSDALLKFKESYPLTQYIMSLKNNGNSA